MIIEEFLSKREEPMASEVDVSIICNSYNQKKYISQAVDSFLEQDTDYNYEIILLDDASTDGTQDIITNYKKKYPERIVTCIEKENQYSKKTPITAITALNVARGDYIALCEGDDFWVDREKIQLQCEWLNNHPECSLVVTEAIKVDANGNEIDEFTDYFRNNADNMRFEDVIKNLSSFPYASMFFRRRFYVENKGFLLSVPNYDYVLKLLLASYGSIHCIRKKMVAYRVDADGSWSLITRDVPERMIEHIQLSIDCLMSIDEYTNSVYSNLIKHEIHKRKYFILQILPKRAQGRFEYYDTYYKEMSVKEKAFLRLGSACPTLTNSLRVIRKKMKNTCVDLFGTRSISDTHAGFNKSNTESG